MLASEIRPGTQAANEKSKEIIAALIACYMQSERRKKEKGLTA